MHLLKKYWFLLGLVGVFLITLADTTGSVAGAGQWLKARHGPGIVIFVIFLFSGLLLDARQIRSGLADVKGTAVALLVIFALAPLIAVIAAWLPFSPGIVIGLFLVAVMPTTLSSGVVMTGTAGGNIAHALLITVISNSMAVVTIPFTLSLLLKLTGETAAAVVIDKSALMIRLTLLVLLPLVIGLTAKYYGKSRLGRVGPKLQTANQWLILVMVWIALSGSRQTILDSGLLMAGISLLVLVYHSLLLAGAALAARLAGLGRGRRESVLFMGAQKTLTLSVILQVSLFPQYGIALGVCVLHHILHMMVDGWLAGRLGGDQRI